MGRNPPGGNGDGPPGPRADLPIIEPIPATPSLANSLPFGSRLFETLFDNLYDGIYLVDRNRQILYWNRGAERISGYTSPEVVGRFCHQRILDHADADGRSLCLGRCPLSETMRTGQPGAQRIFLRHKDGRRIAVDVHVMPIRDDDDQIVGGVEVFRDASAMVALESAYGQMRELSQRDPLTGVANRGHIDAILNQQVGLLGQTGIPFGVVMADLDHFKRVNDTWGHPIGDRVLIDFARTLDQNCRPTDTVGRYGGEEFLVILPGARLDQAAAIAERMRTALAEIAPPAIDSPGISASFGVAEAAVVETAEGLLRRVDAALYLAKRQGRDRVARAEPADPNRQSQGGTDPPTSSRGPNRVP